MKLGFDLEVDVNGEEIFYVDKEILCSFSGKLSKLLSRAPSESTVRPLQVALHGLPGGPEAFELLTRFCYNNGCIRISPISACLLYFTSRSMEVSEETESSRSLLARAEKASESISRWTWLEVIAALKHCQNSLPLSDDLGILNRLLDSVVVRTGIATTRGNADSPNSASSPELSDLVVLNAKMIEKIARRMISQRAEHGTVSRFLFHYLKLKCANLSADDKRKAIETAIDVLYSLHTNSVSCKGLFDVLRISSSLNLSSCSRDRLEFMIGNTIDRASLDNLLISSPAKTDGLYDVGTMLKFLKHFLACGGRTETARLRKVAWLLDLYMAEVAPDALLTHSKFEALATALPETGRDSHDMLYRAIHMYLEVHRRLTEEEKTAICRAINYEKLSIESCEHLAQNFKFPSRAVLQAQLYLKIKLNCLLQGGKESREEERMVLYAKKTIDPSMENEKLRARLQGMQWRVIELEKACRKMQKQMSKMIKRKKVIPNRSRSLPSLCS